MPASAAGPKHTPVSAADPAPRAAAAAPGPERLANIAFRTPARGYGLFVRAIGGECRASVGVTSDGGARFRAPVTVTSWRCANSQPVGAMAVSGSNGFLYGERLYVTHDAGRAWAREPQPGPVISIAGRGLSVWMLEAVCPAGGRRVCPLRLLESADGGRSWAPSPSQPGLTIQARLAADQGGGVTLLRTGRSSGYILSLPDVNPRGGPDSAPLRYTGDGGRSWSQRRVPCRLDAVYAAATVTGGRTVLAVCAGEPSAGYQPKSVVQSVNGGRTWTTRTACPPGRPQCGGPLNSGYLGGVEAVSPTTAFLVGDRASMLVTRDGGRRWRIVRPLIGDDGAGSGPVEFFNTWEGVALGTGGDTGERPAIWHTADGGRRWSKTIPRIG